MFVRRVGNRNPPVLRIVERRGGCCLGSTGRPLGALPTASVCLSDSTVGVNRLCALIAINAF
jgi:hypothetical protein